MGALPTRLSQARPVDSVARAQGNGAGSGLHVNRSRNHTESQISIINRSLVASRPSAAELIVAHERQEDVVLNVFRRTSRLTNCPPQPPLCTAQPAARGLGQSEQAGCRKRCPDVLHQWLDAVLELRFWEKLLGRREEGLQRKGRAAADGRAEGASTGAKV